MKTVNVHDAKTRLSAILADIDASGETYVVCRNGKPVADLVPHVKRSRLQTHPLLSRVRVTCDLTAPLTEDEWGL